MSETLPQLSERDVLEGMSPDGLTDLILSHGERVTEIERTMHLASTVLEGAYGLTVEDVLTRREKKEDG